MPGPPRMPTLGTVGNGLSLRWAASAAGVAARGWRGRGVR